MAAAIILAIAVSLDILFVSVSYGAEQIRIPLLSAVVLSTVSAGVLTLSLTLAGLLTAWLPALLCQRIGGGLLLGLGGVNLFRSGIRALFARTKGEKRLQFSCCQINFVLEIYSNETAADRDASQSISCREAIWLGLAFSFDSLACGLGAGLSGVAPLLSGMFCLLFGLVAILLGTCLGARLGKRLGACRHHLACVSSLGILTLGLASLLY